MRERDSWILGKPFLQKYLFSFNIDKKIIGFYNLDKNNGNDNNKKKINPKIYLYIVIIIILIGIISWLCYLFAKLIYFKRRKVINKNITSELMLMRNDE